MKVSFQYLPIIQRISYWRAGNKNIYFKSAHTKIRKSKCQIVNQVHRCRASPGWTRSRLHKKLLCLLYSFARKVLGHPPRIVVFVQKTAFSYTAVKKIDIIIGVIYETKRGKTTKKTDKIATRKTSKVSHTDQVHL